MPTSEHAMNNALPPVAGERVLFCKHADVSETHIMLSGSFHWYFLGHDQTAKRVVKGADEWFPVHWLTICDACQRRARRNRERKIRFAAQDAPWIGEPPNITRFA